MADKKDLERAAAAIETFLEAVGAPVGKDKELEGTGRRVAEAYANDLLTGYADDPAAILAEGTGTAAPGMVVVTNIEASTMCPHHLMPATGLVHVGYLPGDRVVGLGALSRLVQCYARRLALQEDLGDNVAKALIAHLGAKGAGCVVDFAPTCMTVRGERQHAARAVTHAWAGSLAANETLRAELLCAIRPGT